MPHLRLCRETDEDQDRALAPIPFRAPQRPGDESMQSTDVIRDAEDAIARAQSALDNLSILVDEDERASAPIKLSSWLPDDDDGPYAA